MSSFETPVAPAEAVALPGAPRPPRTWKFIGTSLWGLLGFVAMFIGQFSVLAYFLISRGGPLDGAALRDAASSGAVISWSVILGLPAALAVLWLATWLARTPFADYLALRRTSWGNLAIGILSLIAIMVAWDLLSRAVGRDATPGFMIDVMKSARDQGVLWVLVIAFCVAAPVSEECLTRGFLYRGWSESFLRPAGAIILSSLVWTAMHLQYDWFFFGEVLSIGLLFGVMRYRSNSTWLTILMHALNNSAATAQTYWLLTHS
jgi:membrane protease YdiL (CAAX protease family)